MQFSTCSRISKKQTCRQQSDHFIDSTPALSVLFFSTTACSVLMAFVFYYNDMLQKVTMQRNQQFSAFGCYQGGLEALPIMPCVWTIISFFSITWQFICYGFHRSRVANRSGISRKKAYLFPLLRSWSTGKCSVRTIYLSSSEISSWPRQFPGENRRTKDVRVFISEESMALYPRQNSLFEF